jgi:hypothetical protein
MASPDKEHKKQKKAKKDKKGKKRAGSTDGRKSQKSAASHASASHASASEHASAAGSHRSSHASARSSEKVSTVSKGQPTERAPLAAGKATAVRHEPGTPGFGKAHTMLRDAAMKNAEANFAEGTFNLIHLNTKKKDDERREAKANLKQALQQTLEAAVKGLKMTGNTGADLLENLQTEAEKLKIQCMGDEGYLEEVRYKHNKLRDCLDGTRDFGPEALQKDLVRNREIRMKCSKLIRGDKQPEELINEEEMDELLRVRNTIRSWYGGQNTTKTMGNKDFNVDVEGARAMFTMAPGDFKVSSGKAV